ncbi:MAG: DUF1990 domain-containing protein [Salinibacterium sp.]|nr:DUF1990 domain-containing protein [Salinibacterium sp.]
MMDNAALTTAPVTYGAVGASQAPDLLSFPPAGFRPFEGRARIGHGEARWRSARLQVLSWGVKRRSGFRVELIASDASTRNEQVYSPDGFELVHPGDTAMLHFGPLLEPVRVVYVIDDADRCGFGYGTLEGHPLQGEESFMIEHRADDSVWIVVRSFSRPSTRWWKVLGPGVRIAQLILTRRYLAALAGRLET